MIEHPDYARIRGVITPFVSGAPGCKGVLYRACSPEYANTRDLLTGEGARKFGGRWNAPGSFPVVYLAHTVEGALAETLGLAGHYGFDPASRLPMTLVAIDSVLSQILDVTNVKVRRALGITVAAMNDCPWRTENTAHREALTQAIGRAARDAGYQGILIPSSLKRTLLNLNIFPDNLAKSGDLKIRRADKLPPPPAPGTV